MRIINFSESFLLGTMFSFRENVFAVINCINRRDTRNHNFLSHYQLGGRQPTENKPLKKTYFDENFKKALHKLPSAWIFL